MPLPLPPAGRAAMALPAGTASPPEASSLVSGAASTFSSLKSFADDPSSNFTFHLFLTSSHEAQLSKLPIEIRPRIEPDDAD
eukprot:CAMPEP_0180645754 /NCGR_PEP_ID=MMETSP1037_2-20121125/49177_1 /TAXON_ID=632150 /ORGANISM="Azadinium spinosum, Strain 3D9" /LENGTH=81 /DNA_ID=CAMNT_0022669671 /DNA_START=17 /DNA_END=258 /DNA_ORIENTATION=-